MNSKGVKATEGLTIEQACTYGGLVEFLKYEQEPDWLIVLAPHGGGIEPITSTQAQSIYNDLFQLGRHVALWTALGYLPGGSAYKHYHIPSTEIEAEDFPKIRKLLAGNVQFARSLALHGTKEHQFFVGGTASELLKQEVASAINEATGRNYVVNVVSDGPYGGVHPRNIANRLARKSVQIEQPMLARREFGDEIAYALVELFATGKWS